MTSAWRSSPTRRRADAHPHYPQHSTLLGVLACWSVVAPLFALHSLVRACRRRRGHSTTPGAAAAAVAGVENPRGLAARPPLLTAGVWPMHTSWAGAACGTRAHSCSWLPWLRGDRRVLFRRGVDAGRSQRTSRLCSGALLPPALSTAAATAGTHRVPAAGLCLGLSVHGKGWHRASAHRLPPPWRTRLIATTMSRTVAATAATAARRWKQTARAQLVR